VALCFLLRGMRAAGWEPALASCAVCGGEGPLEAFHIASGGAVCAQCRPAGSVALKPGMLELLDAYLRGRWSVVAQLDPALRPQATGLIAALAQWNVERRLRTLKLVERGGA
jgi:DNA repair protein RecO (recombination protein O)